ncbi:MAG: polymerase sigma-70 factor, subfamily [Bryobacterales bacterium]|nr:polymerase sigma-70 factor, subfamily [Bryobacterales bacterium]
MQEISDERLIALSADSNEPAERREQALGELFDRYRPKVALWCFRVARDREWSADLAQEVFLKALRSLPGFRGDARFSTWLFTIARNHCFNAIRARAARAEDSLEFLELADTGRRIDDELELENEIRQMRELLNNKLDETERKVMTLHFGEEMTLDSVTRMLGLTNTSGAKAYIVSARRKLQTAVTRTKTKTARPEGFR